jgi:hypothetical protein
MRATHPLEDKIIRSLWSTKNPTPVAPKDFSSAGSPAAVRQALARLAKQGKLRRIRRGLYERPRPHPIIGQTASSSMDVARVIMEQRNAPWEVSGASAANLLGLSEQVPAQLVIQTTAQVPPVTLGKSQIKFKRVAPSSLIGAGTEAGLTIQALRYLGPGGIGPAQIERLRRTLKPGTKRELRKFIHKLPEWMGPIIASIGHSSDKK